MNRKKLLQPLIVILIAAAACAPGVTLPPPTPQIIQQTVVVVITATPPPDSPTAPPQETSTPVPTTISDTATPRPTLKASPTTLALLNIPIEGGDSNKMFFAHLVFPDYGKGASKSLVFQVIAHSPLDAVKDGEGINSVDFSIQDQDGNEVHHRVEKTAAYCAFGGGEPDCVVWDFAANNYKWPNGTKIVSGTYTIYVNVYSKDNVDMNGHADFRINLP